MIRRREELRHLLLRTLRVVRKLRALLVGSRLHLHRLGLIRHLLLLELVPEDGALGFCLIATVVLLFDDLLQLGVVAALLEVLRGLGLVLVGGGWDRLVVNDLPVLCETIHPHDDSGVGALTTRNLNGRGGCRPSSSDRNRLVAREAFLVDAALSVQVFHNPRVDICGQQPTSSHRTL